MRVNNNPLNKDLYAGLGVNEFAKNRRAKSSQITKETQYIHAATIEKVADFVAERSLNLELSNTNSNATNTDPLKAMQRLGRRVQYPINPLQQEEPEVEKELPEALVNYEIV